jgi:hypothetical protein
VQRVRGCEGAGSRVRGCGYGVRAADGGYAGRVNGYGYNMFFPTRTRLPAYIRTRIHEYGLYPAGFSKPLGLNANRASEDFWSILEGPGQDYMWLLSCSSIRGMPIPFFKRSSVSETYSYPRRISPYIWPYSLVWLVKLIWYANWRIWYANWHIWYALIPYQIRVQ